jgi:hypothetical protein
VTSGGAVSAAGGRVSATLEARPVARSPWIKRRNYLADVPSIDWLALRAEAEPMAFEVI